MYMNAQAVPDTNGSSTACYSRSPRETVIAASCKFLHPNGGGNKSLIISHLYYPHRPLGSIIILCSRLQTIKNNLELSKLLRGKC